MEITCSSCQHRFVPRNVTPHGTVPCPRCGAETALPPSSSAGHNPALDVTAATVGIPPNTEAETIVNKTGGWGAAGRPAVPYEGEPTAMITQQNPPSSGANFDKTIPLGADTAVTMPAPPSRSSVPQQSAQASSPSAARPRTVSSADFANTRPEDLDLSGKVLDGYYIKKKLGAGGMGAVCLATQSSLDRDVALKILPGQFASNPDFLARFTREALSAAQMSHHNVIQVYDIGSQENIHYISMEFVRGKSLGDMTRTDGKLEMEDAAGYVLQAARGLAYAHEHGIIHRDIKPDNIMVNEHGIVKIADMGLAKMNNTAERSVGLDVSGTADILKQQAYSQLTDAQVAMGTPSYMAPEQGRDASKVDHRADQYSLGCTLYYLLAGKTPFTGRTTFEIISKHATEPLVPLDTIVKNVPKELSYIIEKMLAKDPADRYPSMKEVVSALEAYLGVETAKGPYTPREHHVSVLEKVLKGYYEAPKLKLRLYIKLAFAVIFSLIFLVGAIQGAVFLASSALGMLVLTPLFHFVIQGVITKDYLFRRVRSVFFGMSLKQWAAGILGSTVVLVLLYFFQLLLPWLAVSLFAFGAALGYFFLITRGLANQRKPQMDEVNEMLKQLRVRGVSEGALQEFVFRFSGAHWEEFFEDLFGYEEMVTMRSANAKKDRAKPRKKFATWRDPIARWLDEVEESRRKAREMKTLAKAEKNRLAATGMDEKAAEKEGTMLAQKAVDGGLLAATAILPAMPSKADIAKLENELHGGKKRQGGKIYWSYKLVRLLVSALMIFGGVAPFIGSSLPQPIIDMMKGYYNLGLGPSLQSQIPVLLAGLALLITVFSRRIVLPSFILLGAVQAIASTKLPALLANPQYTPFIAFYGGVAMAIIGVILLFTTKKPGRF